MTQTIDIDLDAPERLDRVVARLFRIPRAAAQHAIDAGRVNVRGEGATRAAMMLRGSTSVSLDPPRVIEGPSLPLLHRDALFVVIDKPTGLLVHAVGSREDEATVVTTLQSAGIPLAGGVAGRTGVVHRLDRETSGALLLSLDVDAHRILSAQFKDRTIAKTYLAIVAGAPATEEGLIDAPLMPARGAARRLVHDGPDARSAQTSFRVLERREGTTLLEVSPRTGRTHQIRAHLAAIGIPVLGDALYGTPASRRIPAERLFLHAWRLAFDHPADGTRVTVEAPIPAPFAFPAPRS